MIEKKINSDTQNFITKTLDNIFDIIEKNKNVMSPNELYFLVKLTILCKEFVLNPAGESDNFELTLTEEELEEIENIKKGLRYH